MAPRDANWVDGFRGIASFMVVCGHLCTAFVPWLHAPASSDKEPPHLFQLPFFRLCVGGRSAVAIFFLITGYVNSIGPIARSRSGNTEAALSGLARSTLARSGRLVLPTMIATLITWFLANINAYHMTKHVDSTWIRQGWHGPEPTLWKMFTSLIRAEVGTWTTGWDEYDGTQWTLRLFLEGSMMVYLTMLATVLIRPRARKLVFGVLYVYCWISGEGLSFGPLKSLNIITGMFLAELQNEYKDSATTMVPAPIPALMIIAGMFMSSYPQDAPERAAWSHHMCKFMHHFTPKGADIRRYWDSLGASTVLFGIFFSKTARNILTSPIFNFLGRVSFPVYLMHNTLIKSVLTWMVYLPSAMNPQRNAKGEPMDLQRGSTMHIFIAVGIFYYILYRLASLWVQYIDPACGRVVNAFTRWATGDPPTHNGHAVNGHAEKPILLQ